MTALPSSTRRLLKDLQEIRDGPVSVNVNARPLDSDIYQWHGNLRHKGYGIIFHFTLLFPSNYPNSPPSILLSTPLPHPNVFQAVGGWKVCLDMLDVQQAKERKEYRGWSQSYSVRSILMQLEAFLLERTLSNTNVGTVDDAALAARNFECSKCTHKATKPWPNFPSEQELLHRKTREFQMPKVVLKSQETKKPKSTIPQKRAADPEGWHTVSYKKRSDEKKKKPEPRVWKPGHKAALKKEDAVTCVTELEKMTIALPVNAIPKSKDEDVEMQDASEENVFIDPGNAGFFSDLPYELLLQILMEDLSAKDVLNLSISCKHLRFVCLDGFLWKKFFTQRFGSNSELRVRNPAHYIAAFAQELNCAAWDLRCYSSKVSFEDDVLGVGVDWTVNPKTKRVDYISIIDPNDLLSRSAYLEDQVRTSTWNKGPFRGWLPLYINKDHFSRALPDLQAFFVKLSSSKQKHFSPGLVLETIPKMMNTMVVLLMDKGVSLSINAIEGYFLLHRLLLGFIDEYPELQTRINNRLKRFIDDPNMRTKTHEPSLGDLFPLIAASDKYNWSSGGLASALIGEFFDRQVLWTARAHPELVKVPHKCPKVIKADEELLKKWLSAGNVSRRLVAFHVQLLSLLRSNSPAKDGSSAMEQLRVSSDMLYGRPPRRVTERFQTIVKKIMEMDTWPDFFKSAIRPVPSKEKLTQLLQQSVRNSFGKGYHTNRTDFSKIHKSGGSRLLQGGESVSVDIKRVTMKETWRWRNGGTEYLDASCHIFRFDGSHAGDLSYASKRFVKDMASGTYAMTHSGDVINSAVKHGEHTMNIDLGMLKDKDIQSLVFCMTAFSHATLQSFYDPEVSLVMPQQHGDQSLASYNFGSTRNAGNKKSIIMSVLWRREKDDKWEMKAVGELGYGSLSRPYELIQECQQVLRTQLQINV